MFDTFVNQLAVKLDGIRLDDPHSNLYQLKITRGPRSIFIKLKPSKRGHKIYVLIPLASVPKGNQNLDLRRLKPHGCRLINFAYKDNPLRSQLNLVTIVNQDEYTWQKLAHLCYDIQPLLDALQKK